MVCGGVEATVTERYYVEWNGDCWQSVFPSWQSELSALHASASEAVHYLIDDCGVCALDIEVILPKASQRPNAGNGGG